MMRTKEQRAAWRRLSANQRRILSSHFPDDLERDEVLARDTMADLEVEFGPRCWAVTTATVAEGHGSDNEARDVPAMSFAEIGRAMGISAMRTLQIFEGALSKLRRSSVLQQLYFGETVSKTKRFVQVDQADQWREQIGRAA